MILLSFVIFYIDAKSEENTVYYHNSIVFPLSNFINLYDDFERFKIGYQYYFNEKLGIRLFLGYNLKNVTSLKPLNAESDKKEVKEYYHIGTGLKILLIKTRDLFFYTIFDLSFGYDLNRIVGVDFSSLTTAEHKYLLRLGINFGIEYFLLKNLSVSIESGLIYNSISGEKTARIGDNVQEDKKPTETEIGIKPFSNFLNITIYF